MKKVVLLTIGLSVILVGVFYFCEELAKAVESINSSRQVEDICDRLDPQSIITEAYVSFNSGSSWKTATTGNDPCFYRVPMGDITEDAPISLAIARANGSYQVWEFWAKGEKLVGDSMTPFNINVSNSDMTTFMDQGKILSLSDGFVSLNFFAIFILFLLTVHIIVSLRVAHLVDEIRVINEHSYFAVQKAQRLRVELSELPGGPLGWLENNIQQGFGVILTLNQAALFVLDSYPLVYTVAKERCSLVVSPHNKKRLLKKLSLSIRSQSKIERLTKFTEDRLAYDVVRKGEIVRLSLGRSSETFDIEARLFAENLDFKWGQPDFLYFYLLR